MSAETPPPDPTPRLSVRLRFKLENRMILGPGRIQLLERIRKTGSIAAAARSMGMSYRRAWLLVDDTNRLFACPLVESVAGGRRGGGARLTDTGRLVVDTYRRMEKEAQAAFAEEQALLEGLLAPAAPADGDPTPE